MPKLTPLSKFLFTIKENLKDKKENLPLLYINSSNLKFQGSKAL